MNGDEHEGQRDADDGTADGNQRELRRRIRQRKGAGQDGSDRQFVDDQSGRVVHEALAFEDGHQMPGYVEPRQDGGRRDRIRRGDDRPQNKARGPRDRWHHQLERRADGERGGDDQANGQQADGADVGLEVAPGRQQRRLVENRRQNDDQNDFRVERKLGEFRDQPQQRPAHDQRNRIGEIVMPRQPAEGDGATQQEQHQFEQ